MFLWLLWLQTLPFTVVTKVTGVDWLPCLLRRVTSDSLCGHSVCIFVNHKFRQLFPSSADRTKNSYSVARRDTASRNSGPRLTVAVLIGNLTFRLAPVSINIVLLLGQQCIQHYGGTNSSIFWDVGCTDGCLRENAGILSR